MLDCSECGNVLPNHRATCSIGQRQSAIEEANAKQWGHEVGISGDAYYVNPYPRGSRLYDIWRSAWLNAKAKKFYGVR